MQDVLDLICRKRKMASVKDWALLSSDYKVLVMLDRTVASLEGNSELVLVMRSTLPSYGYPVDGDRKIGKTTDPNGTSLFFLDIFSTFGMLNMCVVCCSIYFQACFGNSTEDERHGDGFFLSVQGLPLISFSPLPWLTGRF